MLLIYKPISLAKVLTDQTWRGDLLKWLWTWDSYFTGVPYWPCL